MSSPTFLGAPRCEPDAGALRSAGARAAFLGAPVDTGVVPARPGTTLGPDACRAASAQFAGYPLYDSRIDGRDHWRLVDCGDAGGGVADLTHRHAEIERAVGAILDAGALPIVVGGDHSIPIPALSALCSRTAGSVGYLQLDAHLDTAHAIDGETRTMASPVARAVEHGNVAPENVAIVGVRGAANSFEEIAAAEALGVRVFGMDDCIARGAATVVEDALDVVWAGTDAVYVSFDNDAMDAACAPGTTAPEPGGFTAREMIEMAKAIGRRGVSSLDVAELSPPYDPAGITARLDCYWILHVLAARAAAERGGGAQPGQ